MKTIHFFSIFIMLIFSYSCNEANMNSKENEPDSRSNIIDASEIISKLSDGENIQYTNATIIGEIDFTKVPDDNYMTPGLKKNHVNSSLLFYNCTFKNKITAHNEHKEYMEICKFENAVTFMDCTFQDSVNFNSSEFYDLVNFSKSQFHKLANFKSAYFNYKENYFEDSKFYAVSKFNLMTVDGNISFFKAIFDGFTLFQNTKFKAVSKFQAAIFNDNTVFEGIKFYDDAFFNYAEFEKKNSFNNSFFLGRAEFIKTKFKSITEFKNCNYYGKTSYNNSEIKGVLTFEGSYFLLNEPKPNDFILDKNSNINFGRLIKLSNKIE